MKKPKYSLTIGRFQPFHDGHKALINTVLAEGKNVCIAMRDTPISDTDPYTLKQREKMIRQAFPDKERVKIIAIPDIEDVIYGRDVGWGIREIRLDPAIESISATKIRANKKHWKPNVQLWIVIVLGTVLNPLYRLWAVIRGHYRE